ncbi:MAG: FIST N-terminal domain-containing protein [Leptolyngbyaceae bacterium]|nr:FIST N-terminal domain-containing protein [Leptolyngbyaceae bacterium]
MSDGIQWTNALSTRPSLEAAVQEVVEQAQQGLTAAPDFGIVFISSVFESEYPRLLPLIQEYVSVPVLIGCSGGGIVGMNRAGVAQELEAKVALSLSLGRFPGAELHPFLIQPDQLPDLDGPPQQWIDLVGVPPQSQPDFIILADPMASGLNDLLQGLDFAYPGSVKVGGLASTSSMSGRTCVFYDRDMYLGHIVGVALSGNIKLDAIVAQGCRPIGPVFRVVEGERNIILNLQVDDESQESQSPLEALQALLETLNEDDREKMQHSLFVGVAQSEFKTVLEPGDFLIRNPMGIDPRLGALAIGDRVRPGQRIQFHLRDATTSADDLDTLLYRYRQQTATDVNPAAALMFSCLGRGEGLYNKANFDSGLFHRILKDIPISGFFCSGEIGPVGGTTFIHGYTSVFGILRRPAPAQTP